MFTHCLDVKTGSVICEKNIGRIRSGGDVLPAFAFDRGSLLMYSLEETGATVMALISQTGKEFGNAG